MFFLRYIVKLTHREDLSSSLGGQAPTLPAVLLALSQDQRKPVLAAADHHNFGIRTLGQVFRGLDAFPFQQLRADALSHDLLEVADARGFDPLALGFLSF